MMMNLLSSLTCACEAMEGTEAGASWGGSVRESGSPAGGAGSKRSAGVVIRGRCGPVISVITTWDEARDE